jgi:hypothetical protein
LGGQAHRFGSSKLADFDGALHRALKEESDFGEARSETLSRVHSLARENRKRMNQIDGYWILDFSGVGVEHAQTEVLRDVGPIEIMLMTDGFSRLVEMYFAYTWDGLLERAIKDGLEPLYSELREIERNDHYCAKFPRLKPCDDATAVLLSWHQS